VCIYTEQLTHMRGHMKRYDIEDGKIIQCPSGKYIKYDSHMQANTYMKHRLDMMMKDMLHASSRAKLFELRADWYRTTTYIFLIVSVCLLIHDTEL
jgi:hypothetical protein